MLFRSQIEVLQDVLNDNFECLVTKKNLNYLIADLKRDAKCNDKNIEYKMTREIKDAQFDLQSEIRAAKNKTDKVKLKLDIALMFAALIVWIVFLALIPK